MGWRRRFRPRFVGSPSTVAALIQEWIEETDVDGFNLTYAIAHETFADVAGYLMPELQRRDVFKRAGDASREAIWRWRSPRRRSPAALYRNLALTASDARTLAPST